MTPLATSTFLQVLFATLIAVPVILLWIAAVVDVIRRGGAGLKTAAVLVLIVAVPILGPVLYFVFRRREPPAPEAAHLADVDRHREAARRPVGGTGMWR